MAGGWFHLAQVNVARALAPLDDPRLASFASQIPNLNAAAERTDGFVWRYTDDDESPGAIDSRLLFNLSVWQSPQALKSYVWGEAHAAVMRRRAQWFEPPTRPPLALWWLPAGDLPRPAEALQRLAFLKRNGPTAAAFSFREPFAPPEEPPEEGVPGAIRYDNRRFAAVTNSENGDVSEGTLFEYGQSGGRVRARYSGPGAVFGSLVAAPDAAGVLDMRYRHFTPTGELRAGVCRSTPEALEDGRIRLREEWRWTTGDQSSGSSILEEIG